MTPLRPQERLFYVLSSFNQLILAALKLKIKKINDINGLKLFLCKPHPKKKLESSVTRFAHLTWALASYFYTLFE